MAELQSPVSEPLERRAVNAEPALAWTIALALAGCTFSLTAQAQSIWKWRDATGAVQISDRAPSKDIPDKDILLRPVSTRASSASEAASSPASAASNAAGLNGVQGVDSELENRKRKLQQEQQASKQAQEAAQKERQAAVRADNCERARSHLAAIDSGQRMARLNSKGEREFLDDTARASERQRSQAQVDQNCR